jgi:dTDP-4-amino-4,6-dideoxygalactose transaminase
MKTKKFTRREVIAATSAGVLGTMINWPLVSCAGSGVATKLAINGGEKVHKGTWPGWPVWDQSAESGIIEMLRSGRWWRGRGEHVAEFEQKYGEIMGARCLATASGTTALLTALNVLGVDAGDEVLISPYTFIATYNVIFLLKALPVFIDSDPETFLINPSKIEERITERTSAIVPVHIYGLPVDMDRVNTIASKNKLKVVEDACQAWLGVYKGKKLGTLGDLGCHSFQNSKNIPAGEGGCILGNNDEIMDMCTSFHNCGRPVGTVKGTSPYPINGSNYRMTQTQALILLSQMQRFEKDNDIRYGNAMYLDSKLKKIPGIIPCKLVKGNNRSAYHLYATRYIKEKFNNVPKERFLAALRAEGIPAGGGYGTQNKFDFIEKVLTSKGYKRLYSESRLKQWREENELPGNDRLVDQAVVYSQSVLLGSRNDMDDIVNAITKIYENRDQLAG